MRQLRRRDRLVLQPSRGGTFLHADLMGRSDTITPFPHPERGGVMRQYSDNPYLSAGAIGVGEGGRVGRAKSHVSSPLQSSGADAASNSQQNIGLLLVRPGSGQHPQVENTSAMPQADWCNPHPLSSSGHAIKETEAADHRGPDLAMRQEVNGEGSGVVQHQDAGRIPSEEGLLRDITPAYDSIMQ
ncbi:hypothetical protein M405DRAFT_819062 [Rhizopogon salebrosus TDB-379]|nr:hypothetical protein M405DRAFT_819062 [Rhizopogon salebrosus TDB-379]